LAECAQSRIPLNERSSLTAPTRPMTTLSPSLLTTLEQFIKGAGPGGNP
jgi:hypothetical protein